MRTYPYTVYALRSSFDVSQVTLVGLHPEKPDTDVTADGKAYCLDMLYLSKSAAIAAGFRQLEDQKAAFKKQQEIFLRRRRRLTAAFSQMQKEMKSIESSQPKEPA